MATVECLDVPILAGRLTATGQKTLLSDNDAQAKSSSANERERRQKEERKAEAIRREGPRQKPGWSGEIGGEEGLGWKERGG